jgi:hypothetical protein
MTILIAYDPGKVTGIFVWSEGAVLLHDQRPWFEFLTWMEDVIPLYAGWGLEVVGEKYTISGQTMTKGGDAHWSIGTNEIVRYWCLKYSVPFLDTQTPSQAKSFSTDLKLKHLGWFQPTKGGHANDAARHGLVRLVDRQLISARGLP